MSQHQFIFDKQALAVLCRRYSIRRLSLFGSVLRDDFSPQSDIDVLVEFDSGATPSLLTLGGIQADLCKVFQREVDLKTPAFLSRYFRNEVLRNAQVQYAA